MYRGRVPGGNGRDLLIQQAGERRQQDGHGEEASTLVNEVHNTDAGAVDEGRNEGGGEAHGETEILAGLHCLIRILALNGQPEGIVSRFSLQKSSL